MIMMCQNCANSVRGECVDREGYICHTCLDSGTFLYFKPTPVTNKLDDSGERTQFETGAVRDMHTGKGRFDLLPWYGIWEVAKHCEDGAVKYGEHNVDKGIPIKSLIDSGCRHLAKFQLGMDDEDHLRAAAWNLLWALQQRYTHPEINNITEWKNGGNENEN